MIQEGLVERVCVAVVLGTPEEAAAFVRQLAPSVCVSLVAGVREPSVIETPPTTAPVPGSDEELDELDLAIIHLREVAGLTSSECLVFALRARAFTNGEIADVLDLAVSTVKCHVNHALRKLGERRGARPARVIVRAVAEVRGRPVAMTRDHDAWLRPLRIALARLEPKADVSRPKAARR